MRINSSGNVGIGLTGPAHLLHVQGDATDGVLVVSRTSNTDQKLFLRGGAGSGEGRVASNYHLELRSGLSGSDSYDLSLSTSSGVALKVDATNNNIGIGTTSPDALLDIGVNNIITLDDTGSSTGFIGMGSFNDGSKNRAQGASYFGFGLEIDRPNANISFNAYASTGITTSGTNILVLKNTGNVGIGTSSPAYKLDVSGGNMAIRNSAGPQLLFFEPGRSYTDGMRLLRYQDKLSLTYGWNANEEALTVVGGTGSDVGNVGIGTTSPSAKLHVNGVVTANDSIQVQNDDSGFICRNAAGTVIGTVGAESSSTPNIGMFTVRNNGNNKIVLNSNGDSYFIGGRIGIGTTSPTEKLRVQGASGSDLLVRFQPFTNNAQTKLYLSSVSSGDGGYFYNANDNTSGLFAYGDYTFYVGTSNISGSIGNPRMIIKQGGNVGIGTTSPLSLLDLGSTAGQKLYVYASNTIRSGFGIDLSGSSRELSIFHTSSNASNGDISFGYRLESNGSYTERMRLTGAGKLGIGTNSPTANLEVGGAGATLRVGPRYPSGGDRDFVDLIANGTDSKVLSNNERFHIENNSGHIIINPSGSVGIGLTAPGAKVEILDTATGDAQLKLQGNNTNQGSANNVKVVKHYPVVSSGNKLIIPVASQGNLNSTTIVRIFGHGAKFNTTQHLGFTADFAFGHLHTNTNLTVLASTGNISGIAVNGSNIEISFTTAYTSSNTDGLFATIEFMTNVTANSINIANIAMN